MSFHSYIHCCAERKSTCELFLTGLTIALISAAFIGISSPGNASAGLLAPTKVCKDQNLKAGSTRARDAMVCMSNFARRKKGLKPYRHSSLLDRSATSKVADMIRCKSFSHEACGRDFVYWQEKYGYLDSGCWSAGENIAWGSGGLGTVRSIFNAWLHSPGHRAAILNTAYTEIGVGQKRSAFQGYRGSSVWVQHFGTRGC